MMRLFHVIIVVIVYIISSFKKAGFRPRPFLHLLLSFSTSLCHLSILSDVFTRTFEHVSESDEEYSRASEKPNEIDAQRERKVPFNLPVTSYVRQTGQARRGYINYNIYVDLQSAFVTSSRSGSKHEASRDFERCESIEENYRDRFDNCSFRFYFFFYLNLHFFLCQINACRLIIFKLESNSLSNTRNYDYKNCFTGNDKLFVLGSKHLRPEDRQQI